MKHLRITLAAGLLAAGAAHAELSAGDQYNLDQIRSGAPAAIRAAAQNIEASGASSPVVTDALAEVLLKNQSQSGNAYVDALSWSCKALAATGNKRYYSALKQVSDNPQTHKKTRKYCNNAAAGLGGADGEQYALGMAASAATAAVVPAAAPAAAAKSTAAAAAPAAAAAADGAYKPITEVKPEMSQQQAFAIAGPPTSTNAHVTGKAWIPFNFKGGDSYRTIAHYKGQGRIIFSNTSAYSTGQRVLEVQIDPNEAGY
ncbi:hypothetical protein [Solimonas variicoloris]|uniref:hypothetical protein n=1 Tax=Solimonas variicoloris TaxID=254408 RepID=UPI000364A61D|nr:hypothetical protein [Solimonas variicoloris]